MQQQPKCLHFKEANNLVNPNTVIATLIHFNGKGQVQEALVGKLFSHLLQVQTIQATENSP